MQPKTTIGVNKNGESMTTIRLIYESDEEHNEALQVLLVAGNLVLSPADGGALPEGVYTVPSEALRLLDRKQIRYQVIETAVSLPAYS